ncbi:hypothetical protein ACGFX8_22165 [Streptomyces sp. NPDC048362]|uniref:hypothetical protein n=1 Tax=Streptomyces sp. NPDC048362 TaxID=3365539 RepID=UPI00371F6383
MTIRSSSPRPDDSLITPEPAASGVATPGPHVVVRPAPLPDHLSAAPHQDEPTYGDPLRGLVHAAVADRPVEDVVRLITLLERSPEHARTTADALRAAAVDRSVEDVTRLVALLSEPPREPDSAQEAIRAATERRSLEDVTRLMQLLHRAPAGSECGQAAVRAAAASRPVEELAELISRLAADGAVHPGSRTEPGLPASAGPRTGAAGSTSRSEAGSRLPEPGSGPRAETGDSGSGSVGSLFESDTAEAATAAAIATVPGLKDRQAQDRQAQDRSGANPSSVDRSSQTRSTQDRSSPDRVAQESASAGASAKDDAANGRSGPNGPFEPRSPSSSLWVARVASLLMFLCGLAHTPRYWTALSQGVLGATIVVSGLCLLLALALPARTAQARIVAATAAVGVTVVIAAVQMSGRFTPPGLSRMWTATLAPSWLAGTAAVVAALAALVALTVTLTAGSLCRDAGR